MLPSLILLWVMMTGSSLLSGLEPAELPGLPPLMKALTAACLLYSSSTSRRRFALMKNQAPPAIAAIAMIPTTTPAAMPAVLGPEEPLPEPGALEAVTTTV
jgi:hypothetical protein